MTDTADTVARRKYLMPETFIGKDIPAVTRERLYGYLEKGTPPGAFLYAVLTNNLAEAALKADSNNKHLLSEYIFWLFDNAPENSWGSTEAVKRWKGAHSEKSTTDQTES